MASRKTMKVLGISGSLRAASGNAGLIRAAAASAERINAAGKGYHIDFRIHPRLRLPLYDGDLEAQPGPKPSSVLELRQAIAEADALLIASPEYNYSVSGVLKNAIDWASRPWDGYTPLLNKPAAIMGAAGVSGSSRSQYHLRQVLQGLAMPLLPKPEVMCNLFVPGKINAEGDVVDENLKAEIERLVLELAVWTDRFRA